MIGKQQGDLLRGRVTAAALISRALDKCAKHPSIMTLVTEERAHAEAEEADARLRAGQARTLEGFPAVYKDLFDIKDYVTTAGSRVLANVTPATRDADLVLRLRNAGAVTLGRTNMTELAFSGLGLNPHFGTPELKDMDGVMLAPGGSSSGAAAAVARGIAAISIGTDTSGSIRVPASFWGLVGYKASAGRYPQNGMMALAPSLDSIGLIAKTVADIRRVDAILSPALSESGPSRTLVIPEGHLLENLEPDVSKAFSKTVERLVDMGFRISRQSIPEIDAIMELQTSRGTLVGMEAFRLYGHLLEARALMDPNVADRLEQSAGISDADYVEFCRTREHLKERAAVRLGGAILICPTVKCTAPALSEIEADEAFRQINGRVLSNTMAANLLDWCAVSLPCGQTASGRFIGLMLAAAKDRDLALLATTTLVEQTLAID